jgi:NAD(P)-dependent dehydrogenase (short-subunit alcohol dehydrogenase family)
MRLDDKTAFLTGARSGLGRAACERFAAAVATVVAADVDHDGASETAERLWEGRTEAEAHGLDVRDASAFETAIAATFEEYGLDILFNNAGISHDRADMEEVGADERDRVLDVNVKGVWNGCEAAIPHLEDQGSGAVGNTGSLAGVIGSPGLSAYSLSKGAVVNFTRPIAAELGPHGVRANAVCPGVTDPSMPRKGMDRDRWEEVKAKMAEQYPLRRLGRPEDVANAMLFLASEEAAWITGQALVVDGRFSCA